MTPPNALAAQLAHHEDFVRRTLRALLHDENEVHDVVQETWLKALRARGDAALSRPWLARTARHIAISRWRSADRRRRRESARDVRQPVASADESLQRVEERARVVEAIMALASPYQDVVLLRYEAGLSVRAIAEQRGTTESTIRSQLSRAHGQLRGSLDAEFGARRRWAALALPVATFGARPAATAALVALSAAAGLAAVGAAVWGGGAPGNGSSSRGTLEVQRGVLLGSASTSMLAMAAPQEEAAPRTAVAPAAGATHLPLPRAVLLDRSYYRDYELATFSFLRGIREDPTGDLVHNDWDVQLSGGELDVRMVTDDNSFIADLTAVTPDEIGAALDWNVRYSQRSAEVHEGHSYVILTRDGDSDIATVAHVVEFVPGRRCVLDWLTTDGTGRTQGSLRNEHFGDRTISEALEEFRTSVTLGEELAQPQAILQIRNGAGGGNQNYVYLNGEDRRVDEWSPEPLDLDTPIEMRERSTAYVEGGWIPARKTFVVTSVRYRGVARGDTNGSGEFSVVVGGESIVSRPTTEDEIQGQWKGRIELNPGDERDTFLRVRNSSGGEVVLEGTFESRERAEGVSWAENPGFFEDVTGVVARELARRFVPITKPDIVLQVRAGAGGGNPNRVDMRGRTSIYVDEVRDAPLDFTEPVTMRTPSEVYFEGGSVPREKVLVVTQIDYRVTCPGDTNGSGYVDLVVGGRSILEVRKREDPLEGSWHGRLILRPDEETRTYLEVGNSSTANVTLRGFLQ